LESLDRIIYFMLTILFILYYFKCIFFWYFFLMKILLFIILFRTLDALAIQCQHWTSNVHIGWLKRPKCKFRTLDVQCAHWTISHFGRNIYTYAKALKTNPEHNNPNPNPRLSKRNPTHTQIAVVCFTSACRDSSSILLEREGHSFEIYMLFNFFFCFVFFLIFWCHRMAPRDKLKPKQAAFPHR
jgi:hypothetical protein